MDCASLMMPSGTRRSGADSAAERTKRAALRKERAARWCGIRQIASVPVDLGDPGGTGEGWAAVTRCSRVVRPKASPLAVTDSDLEPQARRALQSSGLVLL